MSLLYILDNDGSEYLVRLSWIGLFLGTVKPNVVECFDLSDSELNFALPSPETWVYCQLDSAHNPFGHHFRDSVSII